RLQTVMGASAENDEDVLDPATNVGLPDRFRAWPDASLGGKWTLVPNRIPDQAYLLTFSYLELPGVLTNGSAVPLYPEDETMIQAILVRAMKHKNDDHEQPAAYQAAVEELRAMSVQDRIRHGQAPGIN